MAKARRCCCTPEPYKHLFYLAIYLERVFPVSLRDCTSVKEHIHTKYVQVPEHLGSEVIVRASPQDLRAYREFVGVEELLPPQSWDHSSFELDNAPQWVDPGHFWAFKTYGAQGFDTSGRCSYCDFYHAFERLKELEKKSMCRESRARRPSLFRLMLSRVATPTRTPNPKTREVVLAC